MLVSIPQMPPVLRRLYTSECEIWAVQLFGTGIQIWVADTRILHNALLRVSCSICFRQHFRGDEGWAEVCSAMLIAARSLLL